MHRYSREIVTLIVSLWSAALVFDLFVLVLMLKPLFSTGSMILVPSIDIWITIGALVFLHLALGLMMLLYALSYLRGLEQETQKSAG